MKINRLNSRRASERGSLLLVTLIFSILSAVTLTSYYVLVDQEHREVARSQDWNASLALAEAGVDEALAQMNASQNNFSANAWGGQAGTSGKFGPVTRTFGDGSYYSVSIMGGTPPTIYATGFVEVADSSQIISRRVKVTTGNLPFSPFTVGLGALDDINMNGHQIISDSYNSTNTAQSVNGQYDGSYYSGTNGSIASVGGEVNIGQQTINGNLYLGPSATYDSSASQILGTIYYDYNVQYPPVSVPTTDANGNLISWVNAPGTTSYHDFTQNGYYWVNDSGTIAVEPGVTVTLLVTTENFDPSSITLNGGTTNSGSIVMYQNPPSSGGSVTLGGNSSGGAIGNRPENFVYFGMSNVNTVTLSGTSTFSGAIYAPYAVLQMNGGGNSVNVQGSIIVQQATDNGHYYLHYDEALGDFSTGPNRGYIASSWQEF